jgi:hypothetical protein
VCRQLREGVDKALGLLFGPIPSADPRRGIQKMVKSGEGSGRVSAVSWRTAGTTSRSSWGCRG